MKFDEKYHTPELFDTPLLQTWYEIEFIFFSVI